MAKPESQITALLAQLSGGNKSVVDALTPLLYDELRKIARNRLRGEQANQTLNTTGLVHEAYLKLVDQQQTSWKDRAHFLAMASLAMRRILIDKARAHKAQKRGAGKPFVTFDEEIHSQAVTADELLELDSALEQLKKENERISLVVEYSFFGGLTHEEIAEALHVSVPTVRRDWRLARAWLTARLNPSKKS